MISSLYASILALWIVWLSLRVIKVRRAKQVRLGDGDEPELQAAIRAQGNATEYIPISLILLVVFELNGAQSAMIHFAGVCIFVGRLLHARGLLTDDLRYRVWGMRFTIFALIGLAVANVVYVALDAMRPPLNF